MKETDNIYYKVFLRAFDESVYEYYFRGNKKDLYAFIGYIYSNTIERIDRISYIPASKNRLAEITEYYTVNDDGSLYRTVKKERN